MMRDRLSQWDREAMQPTATETADEGPPGVSRTEKGQMSDTQNGC